MYNKYIYLDIDGTTPEEKTKAGIVFSGDISILRSQYKLLVAPATARTYTRVKNNLCYTPNAPVIVENGGKIIDLDGEILNFNGINEQQKQNIANFIKANIKTLKFALFMPKNETGFIMFGKDSFNLKLITNKIQPKQIFTDLDVFIEHFYLQEVAQITISEDLKIKENIVNSTNSIIANVNIYCCDGVIHFTSDTTSKANGIKQITKNPFIIAGNDQNDESMFINFNNQTTKIAVNPTSPILIKNADFVVKSPDELGNSLKKITNTFLSKNLK